MTSPIHSFTFQLEKLISIALPHSCSRQRRRFAELAKNVIMWKAIARGSEVKFLSHEQMFFDEAHNLLFTLQCGFRLSSPLRWDLLQNLNIWRAAFAWHLNVTGLWIVALSGMLLECQELHRTVDCQLFFRTFMTFKMRVWPTSSPK